MIQMGRTQELRILRRTREGLVLGDDDPEEVVLPLNEAPRDGSEDGMLRVFVYPGADGRPLATTRTPRLEVGTFARLRMIAIRGAGAQVDWGFEPPLLVPHDEQHKDMEEGTLVCVGCLLGPKGPAGIWQHTHRAVVERRSHDRCPTRCGGPARLPAAATWAFP
jgi:predicted RNA-binding protein (virulence factor B family)